MQSMSMSVRIRLSAMMFVQFMLFAVWWPPLAAYLSKLGLSSTQMAWTLSSMAIGCLASPIIGMFADRHFASQKVLFVLNLLSAGLLFFAANQTNPTMVFASLLICMLCYMPTWGLTMCGNCSLGICNTSLKGSTASASSGLTKGRPFGVLSMMLEYPSISILL